MLSVPPALIDVLHLRPGAKLGLSAEGNRLVAELLRRPRYTLDQLIAEHDSKAPRSKEDREWLESPPLGAELI